MRIFASKLQNKTKRMLFLEYQVDEGNTFLINVEIVGTLFLALFLISKKLMHKKMMF